jgi:TPR repeat protein
MQGLAPDDTVARDYYRQGAALDYAPSIGEFGEDLYNGYGGPMDRADALRQFRRGAELGDRLSTEWLGYMLQEGTDVPQDLEEARRLYQIAALMGSPWAQNEYGEMLEQGTAGPVDMQGALDMYQAAVEGDEAYAGINAAWMILENSDVFDTPVLGLAYCFWAVDNAPAEDAAEWQSGCDDWADDFSDKEVAQARLRADGL